VSDTRDLILTCAGAAIGLGTLFGVGASAYDFPCLVGYADTGLGDDLAKGQALIAAAKFGIANLSAVLPATFGFVALFFIAMLAPLIAPDKSHRRILMGFALLPLILGALAWIVLTGPGSDCSAETVALRLLVGIAFGAVGLYGAAWVLGQFRDNR